MCQQSLVVFCLCLIYMFALVFDDVEAAKRATRNVGSCSKNSVSATRTGMTVPCWRLCVQNGTINVEVNTP